MSRKITELRGSRTENSAPLCQPSEIGVGDFIDVEPVPRTWILENLLPLGVVGVLAAGGGTGKSFLSLQLAVSIATRCGFLGIAVSSPGSVLMLCAEDEREELHRRLWRIVESMRQGGLFTDIEDELLRERLFVASRVGENNLLTTVMDGDVIRTSIGDRIALTAEQIPALKLIVLDPVSRFRGGDENNNDHATRFVEAVETLRAHTGASILMPHHLSKDGLRAGADRLSPENLRGASALLDAVRWGAAMATLRKEAAKGYGIDPDDAGQYVRLDMVKNNYGPPWKGLWLKREPGGVLVPFEMPPRHRKKRPQGEDRYRGVLPKLKAFIEQEREQGRLVTPNRLRGLAGKSGRFGCSDKTLRAILARAIAEGGIKVHPMVKGKKEINELRTW